MNKFLSRVWARQKGLTIISGRFATDGAAAVAGATPARSSTVGEGRGFTVSKSAGTGIYRVTLEAGLQVRDKDVVFAEANIWITGTTDADAKIKAVDGSDRLYDIQVFTPSTGAALDPLSAEAIAFTIHLLNSTGDNP